MNCILGGGHSPPLSHDRPRLSARRCTRKETRRWPGSSEPAVKRRADERGHGRDAGRGRAEKRAAPREWLAAQVSILDRQSMYEKVEGKDRGKR